MTSDGAHVLRYDTPASCFNEALPIGNGRLGAMVYGGGGQEKLSLNDDTLWAGNTAPAPRPEAAEALPRIRDLLFGDDRHAAEALIEQTFQTEFTQPYLPAGDLLIDWPDNMDVSGYQRDLSLSNAIATVTHGAIGARSVRKYLSSAPDQIVAMHVSSPDQPLSIIGLGLSSALEFSTEVSGNRMILRGKAPSAVIWEDVEMSTTETYRTIYDETSRHFAIVLDVQSNDGIIATSDNQIEVRNAHDLTLRIAVATDAHELDPAAHCIRQLDQSPLDFPTLQNRHIADYKQYFDKLTLELGGRSKAATQPFVPQRLSNFTNGHDDPDLIALQFHYARYLMICSSRAGTMPANLQGIWNEDVMPPWWSNYTININTQMNYWMAEACGLGDCHTALCDFVETLANAGEQTAKTQYGCGGWVANHQTDYRRQTTPVGFATRAPVQNSGKWSMWPMGGAWLSLHLYQHYQYGRDLARLRDQGFPVMKGAATFLMDWLIDDPRQPEFVTTAPSTSPENTYLWEDGRPCAISMGSTMDIAIARALFTAVLEASDELGTPDPDFATRVAAMKSRLPVTPLTEDGRIREYDADWPEAEHPHRHISHLFALCPGDEICPDETPELADAARKTLRARGRDGTGWSLVWKALCWVRLGDANEGYEHLKRLFMPVDPNVTAMADIGGGIYPNLLTACPPFQIEANFGFATTLLEMLAQDHRNIIRLLPALPAQLPDGQITGLHLRNGLALSMAWRNGQLTQSDIHSSVDVNRRVIYGNKSYRITFKAGTQTNLMTYLDADCAGAA